MIARIWSKFRQSILGEKIRLLLPNHLVNILEHLPLAILAVIFYRYPASKLTVIGITGTDGKTTTATLIHKILTQSGKKSALISTVSASIGNNEIFTGFHVTSPHPFKLQKLLRKIVDKNFNYVVIEATSHGLAQNRLFGCNFYIGALTNVAKEHLDYHKNLQNYMKAKLKLFKGVNYAILNRDDQSYEFFEKEIRKKRKTKIISYAIKKSADYTLKKFKLKTSLPGEYNQYNCLAAVAVCKACNIANRYIKKAIADFKGVKGRMEYINMGQDFSVIVDFAHTPNALMNVLKTLRSKLGNKNKLITVFGCAGLRDKEKRSVMGNIACTIADISVLTAEDPRTEDVDLIIDQIAKGCIEAGGLEKKTFFRIPNRKEAIKYAIDLAGKDDIVVVCGKGHERSMCYGKTEYPWSDEIAIKKIFATKI